MMATLFFALRNLIVPFIEIRKTEEITFFRVRENNCDCLISKIYESTKKKAMKSTSSLG